MKLTKLQGWSIAVERARISERAESNGEPREVEGWALVFTEIAPATNDRIVFEFGRDVRDYIVRELTGGVVLAGGDLPRL